MRTLRKYIPRDDFDMPKGIDQLRDTAVLIRQSDHRAEADHVFSRESQLKLTSYAQRLRGDTADDHIRVYDEGAGVSGQKRIDQRKELNRLYHDIKNGLVGSLVIVHEDRLFRDEYHTNDTTFIQLLAEHDVLLFVRTDHRRYDCTKPSDRNSLLEKMIASRNYLDDHVLGRMNGNQEAKALQGLFDGRNLAMGYVTQGKKKQQTILVYEPWAKVVRWMFERFRELDSLAKLTREIDAMPYLFPDPSADDFLRYTFKISMTKVPGGFKPICRESVKYILTNPSYIGAWLYDNTIVKGDNHPAIVDRDLFMWAYQKLTGRNLNGEPLTNQPHRSIHDDGAQAVLKYLLRDKDGILYVSQREHPEYHRQTLTSKTNGTMFRQITFSMRAHLLDDLFLTRVKELARTDKHLAWHIETSVDELEQQHTETVISIDDQLKQVRLEIQKTLAFLHDEILTLTPKEKRKYNTKLASLRASEQELLAAQSQTTHASLKADFAELQEVLLDIPGKLDSCTMAEKQKLARLITESVTIEEVSVHWLRFTVVWRGPLADRPDVCLIWRQRGKRSEGWTQEEDDYIREYYPRGDKWTMLEQLPRRTWNMIYQRAMELDVTRVVRRQESIPENVTIDDLNVIPDRELALTIVAEAAKRRSKQDFQASAVWLYSAGLNAMEEDAKHWKQVSGSLPNQAR
ncbi:recombinase family protein [Dictyobacter formicarum]|uniref:Recombinase domain-containing protein n=1 Tax=Dictyobacter formicarum TaxID=2778368 RepID=A0ABQ3VE37_9CHLR|nr:recombinase family protein [Dictyobacter formicarum]GHO83976.1 hypothetical protein KSZ_19820 [Dictyobacter formicarum]